MTRRPLRGVLQTALCASALLALAVHWLPATPGGAATLPPVDAAPPERPRASAAPPADPTLLEVLHFLRARHSGLADAELPALAQAIVSQARRHGLDPHLVLAVIRVESAGYNFAVSRVGALGLMQLMPATGRELAEQAGIPWYGPATLFDPQVNVRLGTAYLRTLADRYDGDLHTALAAYNWGPGRIDRRLRRGARVPAGYATQVMEAHAAAGAALASRS